MKLFTNEELTTYFSTKYGPVANLVILPKERLHKGQRKLGRGILEFKTARDAAKAFQCGELFVKDTTQRIHYIGNKFVTVQQEQHATSKVAKELKEQVNKIQVFVTFFLLM